MHYFLDELISTNIEMSIIMFDIDYFKSINDQYGHPVGDEVLKEFSKIYGLPYKITAKYLIIKIIKDLIYFFGLYNVYKTIIYKLNK